MRTYGPTVLDHYLHPRNVGSLPEATGVGDAGNREDGDTLRLAIRVEDDCIVEAAFQSFGCPAAIAAGSMVTEMLRGRTLAEALALRNRDVVAALGGLPAVKEACSVLSEAAIAAAVEDHRRRHARAASRTPSPS